MTENKIAIFQGKHIRKILHNGQWWISVIDVVAVLTDSSVPKRYWSDLKKKLVDEGYNEAYDKIVRLKMLSPDGKLRETDCAETETLFRIIQSIPSPKGEPNSLTPNNSELLLYQTEGSREVTAQI
jgi:hypothetical protein